jgi:hypothetical protein
MIRTVDRVFRGRGPTLDTLRRRQAKLGDLSLKTTPEGVHATLRWRIA